MSEHPDLNAEFRRRRFRGRRRRQHRRRICYPPHAPRALLVLLRQRQLPCHCLDPPPSPPNKLPSSINRCRKTFCRLLTPLPARAGLAGTGVADDARRVGGRPGRHGGQVRRHAVRAVLARAHRRGPTPNTLSCTKKKMLNAKTSTREFFVFFLVPGK